MNPWTNLYAPLLGRILLGGFFLWSGIEKVLNFTTYVIFFEKAGYSHSVLYALLFITIEVLFGIALIIDIKSRLAAVVLCVYMITISLLFIKVDTVSDTQTFVQNMAIVGGLLMAVAYGTSRWTPRWQK